MEKELKQLSDDMTQLNDLNNQCVDLITDDKINKALTFLKKAEETLENLAHESKVNKKILILILHNLACCYQKNRDFNMCVDYLEAVIFNYDSLLELKHRIKIDLEYFKNVDNSLLADNNSLGDMILQLRFFAKFHLQMCAVLSQANNHINALKHAKIASYICEDNIIKTYYLYNQIKEETVNKKKNSQNDESEISELLQLDDKLIEVKKIVENLFRHITDIHNYKKNGKDKDYKTREKEIEEFLMNEELKISTRNVLGVKKNNDWINFLNIGNIMYLSAITFDDLDLDSDSKFELLRDAIVEKIVMLTVAYFCLATEIRFFKDNDLVDIEYKYEDSEYWHFKAVELACLYLPSSCPIVKHYISSYQKHYSNLTTIPEDVIVNTKIDFIRSDQDCDLLIKSSILPENEDKFDYVYMDKDIQQKSKINIPKNNKLDLKLNLLNINTPELSVTDRKKPNTDRDLSKKPPMSSPSNRMNSLKNIYVKTTSSSKSSKRKNTIENENKTYNLKLTFNKFLSSNFINNLSPRTLTVKKNTKNIDRIKTAQNLYNPSKSAKVKPAQKINELMPIIPKRDNSRNKINNTTTKESYWYNSIKNPKTTVNSIKSSNSTERLISKPNSKTQYLTLNKN